MMKTGVAKFLAKRNGSTRGELAAQWLFLLSAFSVLGLLFATGRPTLFISAITIAAAFAIASSRPCCASLAQALGDTQLRWIVWPFLAWFLCKLFIAIVAGTPWKSAFPENAFRFPLALCLLALIPAKQARHVFFWSLPLAALCAGIHAVYSLLGFGMFTGRAAGWTHSPVYFGNLSALVMLLSICAALLGQDLSARFRILLCIAAGAAGFAAFASGTRSSALVFVGIIPLLCMRKKDRFHRIAAASITLLLAIVIVLGLSSPTVRQAVRISELQQDVVQAEEKNFNTSAGARVQMWKAALLMFQEHPLTGIGPRQFETEFKRLISEKKVAAVEVFNQPHSDMLNAASSGGLVLLLAYFGIIFGPLVYFSASLRRSNPTEPSYILAILGIEVVAAQFLFGLTNATFDQQIYSTTYAVLVCVLAQMIRTSSSRGAVHPAIKV